MSEELWQSWSTLWGLPDWSPGPVHGGGRAVVVAPHPDDEVLGVGGTMVELVMAGWQVEVVAVSDGEAAFPDASRRARRHLASVRPAESATAWSRLGLAPLGAQRLSLADGELAANEDRIVDALGARLRPGSWCLSPWRRDGHADHEATGRAAARACLATGARLAEFPVWAWHWRRPTDPSWPWTTAFQVRLGSELRRAKRGAIMAFASQVSPWADQPPVLPAEMLAHFYRPFEVLLCPP